MLVKCAEKTSIVRGGSIVAFVRKDRGDEKNTVCICNPQKPPHNLRNGCLPISGATPIGRAIMGKMPGDTVRAKLPNGKTAEIMILSVETDIPDAIAS